MPIMEEQIDAMVWQASVKYGYKIVQFIYLYRASPLNFEQLTALLNLDSAILLRILKRMKRNGLLYQEGKDIRSVFYLSAEIEGYFRTLFSNSSMEQIMTYFKEKMHIEKRKKQENDELYDPLLQQVLYENSEHEIVKLFLWDYRYTLSVFTRKELLIILSLFYVYQNDKKSLGETFQIPASQEAQKIKKLYQKLGPFMASIYQIQSNEKNVSIK